MAEKFLKIVYGQIGCDTRDLYAKWSKTYDNEVSSKGYVTPKRCAKALAQFSNDLNTPKLDYRCGTGLSSEALCAEGFTTIHDYDISTEMPALADEKSIDSVLRCFDPDKGIEISAGAFNVIAAIGVISVDAAPPSTFDLIFISWRQRVSSFFLSTIMCSQTLRLRRISKNIRIPLLQSFFSRNTAIICPELV